MVWGGNIMLKWKRELKKYMSGISRTTDYFEIDKARIKNLIHY
jgi:hypothetical protein